MHRKQGKAGFWQAVRLAGFLVVVGFVLGFTFGSTVHWVTAQRATVAPRVHVSTCTVRDWGNTREVRGHWQICQPAGQGFSWQAMPAGRDMAS